MIHNYVYSTVINCDDREISYNNILADRPWLRVNLSHCVDSMYNNHVQYVNVLLWSKSKIKLYELYIIYIQ